MDFDQLYNDYYLLCRLQDQYQDKLEKANQRVIDLQSTLDSISIRLENVKVLISKNSMKGGND